jgi:hypothetical protein
MYESQYVVTLLRASTQLQREMAKTYNPDRDAIVALCQEVQDASNGLYRWARGIEEDDNGQA